MLESIKTILGFFILHKIRLKAIALSASIVLLLIAFFAFEIYQNKKRVLNEKIVAHRELLANSYRLAVHDTEQGLNYLAFKLMTDRAVVDAFDAQNRDKLYALTMPYFQNSISRKEVDLVGFIKQDGTHFLRMHDPKKFGDNITKKRPMIAQALRERRPILSMDATLYNISLIRIVPIFKDDRFLGILQISADIKKLQNRLNAHSSIKTAIAMDSGRISAVMGETNFIKYKNYSLVSSNDELFKTLPYNYSFAHTMDAQIGARNYIIASRELKTYTNDHIARLICALDITSDEVAFKKEINQLIWVSSILFVLLVAVLHFGFKALISMIEARSNELNKKLQFQLNFDPITQLPNRRALLERIKSAKIHALMLLNIDNFKEINDLYGYEIGDKVIAEFGNTIKKNVDSFPMELYKLNADEYALVLLDSINGTYFNQLCSEILSSVNHSSYIIDGLSIFLSVSMGADVYGDVGGCNIISKADMALKTAKKRRIPFVRYHDTLLIAEEYKKNILWSKKLKDAIDENRLELHYQGIHDASSRHVIKYEALIRIRDRDGSVVPPAMFLEIAKKTHLYHHITEFLIGEIFLQLKNTINSYSINISVDDILNYKMQNNLFELLAQNKIGDRLTFEILESEGIENYEEVSLFISRVKEFGCKIAVDDFGTGYSNFAHILRLDIDYIKIDGSLIKHIVADGGSQNIVKTIVDFAHRLGVETIAEFVSTKEISDKAKELGVDYVQGFYLSKPVVDTEATKLLV